MRKVLATLFSLGACAFVMGQAPMGPPDEMKKLDHWLGEWTGKVKWSIPGMPEQESVMTMRHETEGSFLKSTSETEIEGMKVTEVGYVGYDAKGKCYCSWTFTNFAPTPRVEHGKFEGDNKIVFISDPWEVPNMPGPMISRGTIMKKSAKELTFTLEFKTGDNWTKVASGTFTKK